MVGGQYGRHNIFQRRMKYEYQGQSIHLVKLKKMPVD